MDIHFLCANCMYSVSISSCLKGQQTLKYLTIYCTGTTGPCWIIHGITQHLKVLDFSGCFFLRTQGIRITLRCKSHIWWISSLPSFCSWASLYFIFQLILLCCSDWIAQCLDIWDSVTNCNFWDIQWASIIARCIKNFRSVNWDDYLPLLFTRYLNMFAVCCFFQFILERTGRVDNIWIKS